MEKRYQVFVSSTFTDLEDERKKVIETIMQLNCFPAGMELFPAADDEQFHYIKTVIDDCDYYILIIGGRYGSESFEGVSYTEKEYDYAYGKGIPVLAFIHGNPDNIPFGKTEKDPEKLKKLEDFKQKVSTNRLVKFWNNKDELPGLVALSLPVAMRTFPQVGWIRGGSANNYELLQQLNDLRIERDKYKSDLENAYEKLSTYNNASMLAQGADAFVVRGRWTSGKGYRENWHLNLSWDSIFSILGPYLFQPNNYVMAKTNLEKALKPRVKQDASYFFIDDDNFQTIKIHLLGLKLITVYKSNTVQGGVSEFIELSSEGRDYLLSIKAIKKEENLVNE